MSFMCSDQLGPNSKHFWEELDYDAYNSTSSKEKFPIDTLSAERIEKNLLILLGKFTM